MGKIGRDNVYNREQWLEKTLRKIPEGSRILDAGAGEQQYKKFCSHLNYVAQDFAQYDGEGNCSGLQTGTWDQSNLDIISDITSIPEPDFSFDAILCTEVFEHLPNPLLAVKEFSRLLRKDGQLILTAPFCSLTHFAPFYYNAGFSRYFYEKHLKDYGFKIIEIIPNGNFYGFLAQEIRRIPTIAYNYSNDKVRLFEKFAVRLVLRMLDRFSNKDNNSSELLCFGYHILAVKQ